MIQRQTIAQNFFHVFGSTIVQKILTFAYFIIIARTFGPLDQGRYSAAIAFATLFGVFIELGLSSALTRETARSPEKASGFAGQMLLLRIFLGALVYAGIILFAWLFHYPWEIRELIAVAGVATVIDVLSTSCWGIMRGFQNLKYEAFGGVIAIGVMMAIGTGAAIFHWPVVMLVYAVLCGSFANFVYVLIVLTKRGRVHISLTPDVAIVKSLIVLALPFAGAAIFSRIYTFADTALVARLAGEQHAGFYAAANKLILALNMIPAAFSSSIYPAMSAYFVSAREKLILIFERTMFLLLLLVIPMGVGTAILARNIIMTLYGETYLPSIQPLQMLAPALIFGFLIFPFGALLAASNRQKINTIILGIAASVSLLLNIILIPRFQATGSAWAASATYFIICAASLWAVREEIRPALQKLLVATGKISLASVGMGFTLFMLRDSVHIIFSIAIGALVYGALLFVLKCLTIRDVKTLVTRISL
jgi:O-antigen/teichoic acid export membrane protein